MNRVSGDSELAEPLGREVLGLSRGRKLGTIVALAECRASQAVETPPDLRRWLQHTLNAATLRSLHGVGPKTLSFLKLLVGFDAIAVDVQILKFVHTAGIQATDVEEVEARLMEAGRRHLETPRCGAGPTPTRRRPGAYRRPAGGSA